ncbi:hypothetical protein B1L11_03900 [Microbispora sp. GKU 823]|nr:hypothetical protein B1L11_03900 [Microbispora sp. GKU 823]
MAFCEGGDDAQAETAFVKVGDIGVVGHGRGRQGLGEPFGDDVLLGADVSDLTDDGEPRVLNQSQLTRTSGVHERVGRQLTDHDVRLIKRGAVHVLGDMRTQQTPSLLWAAFAAQPPGGDPDQAVLSGDLHWLFGC